MLHTSSGLTLKARLLNWQDLCTPITCSASWLHTNLNSSGGYLCRGGIMEPWRGRHPWKVGNPVLLCGHCLVSYALSLVMSLHGLGNFNAGGLLSLRYICAGGLFNFFYQSVLCYGPLGVVCSSVFEHSLSGSAVSFLGWYGSLLCPGARAIVLRKGQIGEI